MGGNLNAKFIERGGDIKQILTAHEDDGGNYHTRGAVHTGPSITRGGAEG